MIKCEGGSLGAKLKMSTLAVMVYNERIGQLRTRDVSNPRFRRFRSLSGLNGKFLVENEQEGEEWQLVGNSRKGV